jgi:hypothetical protein
MREKLGSVFISFEALVLCNQVRRFIAASAVRHRDVQPVFQPRINAGRIDANSRLIRGW